MIFGYTLISKERLEKLERSDRQIQTIWNIHRWFAGWKDLDIIWDYVFAETYFGDISTARAKYAEARETDVYGKRKGEL